MGGDTDRHRTPRQVLTQGPEGGDNTPTTPPARSGCGGAVPHFWGDRDGPGCSCPFLLPPAGACPAQGGYGGDAALGVPWPGLLLGARGGRGGAETAAEATNLPMEKGLDLIPQATDRATNFIRETGARAGGKRSQKQKHSESQCEEPPDGQTDAARPGSLPPPTPFPLGCPLSRGGWVGGPLERCRSPPPPSLGFTFIGGDSRAPQAPLERLLGALGWGGGTWGARGDPVPPTRPQSCPPLAVLTSPGVVGGARRRGGRGR